MRIAAVVAAKETFVRSGPNIIILRIVMRNLPQKPLQRRCNTRYRAHRLLIMFLFFIGINIYTVKGGKLSPPLVGVWSGTIGSSKIVACFQAENGSYFFGSYYYLRYREPIPLLPDGDSMWIANSTKNQEEWTFDTIAGSRASGRWKSSKTDLHSLPIRLALIADSSETDGSPCGCASFNDLLETRPKAKVDTLSAFGGRRYRRMRVHSGRLSAEWFQICDTGKAARKINKELSRWYPVSDSGWEAFYSCQRALLARKGEAGALNEVTSPVFWTSRYIMVSYDYSSNCDMQLADVPTNYQMFSTETGKTIDMCTWTKSVYPGNPSVKLHNLINKKYIHNFIRNANVDSNCAIAVTEQITYNLRIDSLGFIFSIEFPYAIRYCNGECYVSFSELMPFLTEKAKKEAILFFDEVKQQRNQK
jgi:hypothetical protein